MTAEAHEALKGLWNTDQGSHFELQNLEIDVDNLSHTKDRFLSEFLLEAQMLTSADKHDMTAYVFYGSK